MGKVCVICGKLSGIYPLCREHLQMKAEGRVLKCEKCGKWYLIGQNCDCTNNQQQQDEKLVEFFLRRNNSENISDKKDINYRSNDLKCIICGQVSNGLHFCHNCYTKYKDRSIDIRITHCNETEILDEYGNLQYKCADGRKVRSRAEAMISDWFYNNKIRSVYEEPVYYLENGETKILHPDFYLPDYGYYIEYNELTSKPYLKSKEYTQKIYTENNLKVIIMSDKDLQDISACLKPLLGLH